MNVNKKMKNKSNYLVKIENAGILRSSKWLVRDVSLEVSKGQIVTLIGPNGSGKTTTAKMALNILSPDEGNIYRNTKRISYVPQKINIDWALPLRVSDFMKITSDIPDTLIVENLKTGDKVVTSGGIVGTIERVVDNDKVEVLISENVKVEIIKSTGIQALVSNTEPKK